MNKRQESSFERDTLEQTNRNAVMNSDAVFFCVFGG